jgi:hypothetical protein
MYIWDKLSRMIKGRLIFKQPFSIVRIQFRRDSLMANTSPVNRATKEL